MGKTSLLGTLPGNVLMIDVPQIEGGESVLAGKDNIDVLPVVSWDEVDQVYQALRTGRLPMPEWVAFDTATALQRLAMRKALREREEVMKVDPNQITQADWGKVGQLMSELVYSYKLLRVNLILLCQEKTRDNGEGGKELCPQLSPMSLDAVTPPMHLIGRLFMYQKDDGTWERRLRVGTHERYMAGVRNIPNRDLPDVIRNPSLGQIFAYAMGKDVPRPEEAKDDTLFVLGDEGQGGETTVDDLLQVGS